MTTVRSNPERHAPVVRWAMVPSVVAGLLCVGAATVVLGQEGLNGALGGALLVVVLLGFGHLTLQMVSVVDPQLQLVIALLTYGLHVIALLAVYAAFQNNLAWTEAISVGAAGVTIMVCAVVWSAGRVVAAAKERTPLFDVDRSS